MTTLPKHNRRPIGVGRPDNWDTPDYATDLITEYIPQPEGGHLSIWEPCTGNGKMSKRLAERVPLSVFETDIVTGVDFLKPDEYPEHVKQFIKNNNFIEITNPPYSKKTQFIKQCIRLGCPWALLMPLTTLEGKERNLLFNALGDEFRILIPKRRIKFERPEWIEKKSSPQFQVAWFTYQFNLPQQITFE